MDNLERAKLKRKQFDVRAKSDDESSAKRVCSWPQSLDRNVCIFCEDASGRLHQFSTLQSDASVWCMAKDLQDVALLAKIEGGDLIALEVKYHLSCLATLCNRHRSHVRETQHNPSDESLEKEKMEARAFAELTAYIESSVEEGTFFFKLSELQSLYESCLKNLGISKVINKVHFKEQLLSHFTEAQTQSDGKNIILVFEKGIQEPLKQAYNSNYKFDTLILSKAAKIVWKEMLNFSGFHFNGSFAGKCQQESVPANLKYLVSMLLNGSSIKDQNSTES